jgi:hypothetical protein
LTFSQFNSPNEHMRVLHAPVNVGNQPWTLSRAERRLGLESDVVVNYQTSFGYPADRVLGSLNSRNVLELINRAIFGWTAPLRYHVLHYYFGRSLLVWDDLPDINRVPFADLKLARRLGRRIFMTLQGCDARLAGESNRRNIATPCAPGRCGVYETCIASLDAQRRALIDNILPLCDRVFYLNPELGHYLPNATFMPYANVDIDAIAVEPTKARERPIIVHAPSDPKIKGTPLILEALEALSGHFAFDLVLVQGKTHEEAMRIYRDADLVVDQVLAGWYGGLAVEVMAMGKPVASAIRKSDLSFIPVALSMELPTLRLEPATIREDLADILRRRAEWPAIGKAGRRYVERWHHPDHMARALYRIYCDPQAPLVICKD